MELTFRELDAKGKVLIGIVLLCDEIELEVDVRLDGLLYNDIEEDNVIYVR